MAQYAQRAINITISRGLDASTGKPAGPTFTLSGLRVRAVIVQQGNGIQGELQLLVYGLQQQMINNLTRFGTNGNQVTLNSIVVTAGDVGGAMSTVYSGTIQTAYGDFAAMPEVPLNITALAALSQAVAPVPSVSFKGSTDVATLMAGFAKQGGWTFKDGKPGGTHIAFSSPHFKGTLLDQIKACARAANISFNISNDVLTIWARNGATSDSPVLVSPETGLVGYPSFSMNGVVLTTLFNPDMALGRQIEIVSSVTPACGKWNPYTIIHEISSQMPNGPWFSHIQAGRPVNG